MEILKKVQKAVQFKTQQLLKSYNDLNAKFRTDTKNDFGQDLFKLMNYSKFEKTFQNSQKQREIRLVAYEMTKNKSCDHQDLNVLNIYVTNCK